MNCPPQIANILLSIVSHGVVFARAGGWSNDALRAALEANHIHNLCGIIASYSEKNLRYYWRLERTSYIESVLKIPLRDNFQINTLETFEPLWAELKTLIPDEWN